MHGLKLQDTSGEVLHHFYSCCRGDVVLLAAGTRLGAGTRPKNE